jgi:hypothetical protein
MSFTGYNVNSVDLIYIFKPKTSGSTNPTGFISGGVDFEITLDSIEINFGNNYI